MRYRSQATQTPLEALKLLALSVAMGPLLSVGDGVNGRRPRRMRLGYQTIARWNATRPMSPLTRLRSMGNMFTASVS